ncbi:MAG: DegQ family serine endoprotease [Proteobacteria bacterium]|nr:DegQ family serine endoprotease [Pseudomonadota bacterium]MBU1688858.1 DegQ family serine endoprotease [Pseudomonadota bacterium]
MKTSHDSMLKRLILLGIFLMAITQSVSSAFATSSVPENFANLVEKLGPTVVNIYTTKVIPQSPLQKMLPYHNDQEIPEFFKRFFDFPEQRNEDRPKREQRATSLGSGIIISADGYIATNNHVVEDGDEIRVRLTTHEEYDATLVGRDPKTDVALIKIEPKGKLIHAEFGNSEQLRVGDWVLAIGNPFGFENTVTAGIVSGKGRSIGDGQYENFIQTDASINMGNSGGPLFNLKGELVGINTAIFSRTGGNIGLGFAIPVNMAKNVIEQLRDNGTVTRGWLGVMIQHVTADLARQFGLERPMGALVGEVVKDSPADKAGLKQGDIIIEYMGREVTQMSLLPSLVAQTPVDTKADLVIIRKGQKEKTAVTIGKLDEEQITADGSSSTSVDRKLGLTVQELTPELAKSFSLTEEEGLLISNVAPDSPAAEAGIKRGEIVLEINQTPVRDLTQFKEILEGLKEDGSILFLLKRDDHARYVVVKNK